MINGDLINMKSLLSMTMADIDLFLLMDETQEADNNKEYFTREEIRSQLKTTLSKMCNTLLSLGYDINNPLDFIKSK